MLPVVCAIQVESEVAASRSADVVSADAVDVPASSDDTRQSRDVQEMTSFASRNAGGDVMGDK